MCRQKAGIFLTPRLAQGTTNILADLRLEEHQVSSEPLGRACRSRYWPGDANLVDGFDCSVSQRLLLHAFARLVQPAYRLAFSEPYPIRFRCGEEEHLDTLAMTGCTIALGSLFPHTHTHTMTGCTIGLCTIGLFIYSHTHTHTHTHRQGAP